MNTTKTKNSVETAYDFTLDSIVQRKFIPGEVITENLLSKRFGIGRTPIREAVKKLEIEGLIVTEKGTKRIYYLSDKDLEEIFNLKIVIEGAIAGWAAENKELELHRKLSDIIALMQNLGKDSLIIENPEEALKTWLNLDYQFHDVLFDMAGNKRVIQIIKTLNIQWRILKVGFTAIEGRINKAIDEHISIGNAILNNDANVAKEEMVKHLTKLKDTILKLWRTFN